MLLQPVLVSVCKKWLLRVAIFKKNRILTMQLLCTIGFATLYLWVVIQLIAILLKKYFVMSKNVCNFAPAFREKNDLLAQLV